MKSDTNLQLNDIVHINDNFKRRQWLLGRITNILPGADGVVRVVEVKTSSNTLVRPVSKLRKLDVLPEAGGM